MKRIFIASDHRGVSLKCELIVNLKDSYDLIDIGPYDDQPVDYPQYAQMVSHKVLKSSSYGILICATGIGMSIAANRHKNIRAALCLDINFARLCREHNNANILILSADFVTFDQNINIVHKFLNTDFIKGKHQIRIDKIEQQIILMK